MGLKATRRLLSIILCVVLSFSTMCGVASALLSVTIGSQGFFSKHIITSEVVDECNRQLAMKYASLEAESGIPSRVFEAVSGQYGVKENLELASQNIFSDASAELYDEDRVDYFYNLCIEYLKGNSLSYNKRNVRRVSERAASIYSETVGIQGAELIKERIYSLGSKCNKACSFSAVGIAACIALYFVLYGERRHAYSYISGGVAGGGIACLLGAIVSMLTGGGSRLSITPQVYQQSLISMTNTYFCLLALAGAVLCAGGIFACFKTEKRIKK